MCTEWFICCKDTEFLLGNAAYQYDDCEVVLCKIILKNTCNVREYLFYGLDDDLRAGPDRILWTEL